MRLVRGAVTKSFESGFRSSSASTGILGMLEAGVQGSAFASKQFAGAREECRMMQRNIASHDLYTRRVFGGSRCLRRHVHRHLFRAICSWFVGRQQTTTTPSTRGNSNPGCNRDRCCDPWPLKTPQTLRLEAPLKPKATRAR